MFLNTTGNKKEYCPSWDFRRACVRQPFNKLEYTAVLHPINSF